MSSTHWICIEKGRRQWLLSTNFGNQREERSFKFVALVCVFVYRKKKFLKPITFGTSWRALLAEVLEGTHSVTGAERYKITSIIRIRSFLQFTVSFKVSNQPFPSCGAPFATLNCPQICPLFRSSNVGRLVIRIPLNTIFCAYDSDFKPMITNKNKVIIIF